MEGNDSIRRTFNERFERIFNKRPNKFEPRQVFNWLDSEGTNPKSYEAINTLDELRRESESYFCQFKNLRDDAEKWSNKVNNTLKKAYDKLREKKTSFEVSTKGIKREKEKEPPPE
jgi:hypothetical protein